MRGVQRIAEQNDVVVVPVFVADHRKTPPVGAIADQLVALEQMRPHVFQIGDGFLLAPCPDHGFGLGPGRVGRFDDPGAHILFVLVGAQIPDAEFVGGEVKRERRRRRAGAKPDEMIAPQFDLRLEMLLVALADEAVDAVRSHDQVGVFELLEIGDFPREVELDAEFAAARVQDQQQRPALGAAETMSGRSDRLAVEVEVDLIPVGKFARDRLIRRRVIVHEIVQRLVGKDDAEAERVVGFVTLIDGDIVVRKSLLH